METDTELKTYADLLKELPYGYGQLALRNCINLRPQYIDSLSGAETVQDALWVAFPWNESPEGHEFWKTVVLALRGDKPFPPLPAKSIQTWFQELPDKYSDRALLNMILSERHTTVLSMQQALMVGIDWESTKEGVEFWIQLHRYYKFPLHQRSLPSLENIELQSCVKRVEDTINKTITELMLNRIRNEPPKQETIDRLLTTYKKLLEVDNG